MKHYQKCWNIHSETTTANIMTTVVKNIKRIY